MLIGIPPAHLPLSKKMNTPLSNERLNIIDDKIGLQTFTTLNTITDVSNCTANSWYHQSATTNWFYFSQSLQISFIIVSGEKVIFYRGTLHSPFVLSKLDPVPFIRSHFKLDARVFVKFFYGCHNVVFIQVLVKLKMDKKIRY